MPDFVVLTLAAPMGAFGELAGHERRGTALWPARSAVLGLVGAALGVRRGDEEGQRRLRDWSVAVSVLTEGRPLRDYHTVQTVPSRIKRPDGRRAALAAAGRGVNTVVTRRDYRSDVCFGVALWAANPPIPLESLVEALRHPVFMPYLGRRSCPLSAPMAPKQVEADGPAEALATVEIPPWLREAPTRERADPEQPILIASDPTPGFEPDRVERRWNEPIDRARWHFAQREVAIRVRGGGA